MAQVKCRHCKATIDKDKAYSPIKGQYYCEENCYLLAMEKKGGNHSFKPPEGSERRQFTDWLLNEVYYREGFGKDFPNWQMLMAQYKKLIENNPGWTYDTVKYIIWYEKEILGLQLITQESHWSPFTLVDFYSKEAEDYWNETMKVLDSVDNFEDKTITIKSSHKKKPKKMLEF